jgi:CubicO group peptidase (beta-lactamase class C family)
VLSYLAFSAFVFAGTAEKLPVRPAREMGMSAERLANIDRVVRRGITAGGFPGAAVVVGRGGAAVLQRGYGRLGWTAGSLAVSAEETLYDLASLTKVVGTATAAMILYDEGRLDLNAPVRQYLPEFSGGNKDFVTVRQVLTHHSGLPAGKQLWRTAFSPSDARQIVLGSELVCAPGSCFIYSDLGADVIGWIVEAIAGQRLDVFLKERVFDPLGMSDTQFNPSGALASRAAPTEIAPPRGYPLKGEVHDENAFALGGVAGHAGLFSTASDLAVFAQMMLNGGEYGGIRLVSDTAVARFTARTAGTRALGWDTADGDGGAGDYLSSRSYGHTGFTGTSIWIDPDRNMFVILLTNRVHAARARRPAKVISDVRADLADAAALAVVDGGDRVLAMPASFRADKATGWNPAVRRRSSRARRPVVKKRGGKTSSARPTANARTAKPAVKKPIARTAKPAVKKPVARTATTAARKPVARTAVKKPVARTASTAKKAPAKAAPARKAPTKKPTARPQ